MKKRLLVCFFVLVSAQGLSLFAQTPQDPVVSAEHKAEAKKEEAKSAEAKKQGPGVADAKEDVKVRSLSEDPKALKQFQVQLRRRIAKDQKTRAAILRYRKRETIDPERIKKLYKKASDVDGENLKWAKDHVEEFGWPAISTIGKWEAQAFFTIVLHADRDSDFQKKCLEAMSKLPDGQWSPANHQVLEGRIRGLAGRYENMALPTSSLSAKKSDK